VRIFGNLGYKILAVVIAIFLWVVARGSSSVERGFDIPVVLKDIPDDLVVVDQGADVVNVRLLGTRAALRNFDPDRLEYDLDLASAKPGESVFEVDLTSFDLPRGARIVSRSPSRIDLTLERRTAKTVPVRADVEGRPAPGYQVGKAEVIPPRVRISGARSEVLRISEVVTETVDITGATAPVEREVRVSAGPGHVWAEAPESVKVRVPVLPEPFVGPPEPPPRPPQAAPAAEPPAPAPARTKKRP
jgi:YbbR domain-containing protein